jgi:hypothetical protein
MRCVARPMWSNLMFNVGAVADATVHSRSTDFDAVKTFLLSDKMNLDTVKGNPTSFRAWNHQLRAPVLLSTADAVIDRAPLPPFLQQTNVLASDQRPVTWNPPLVASARRPRVRRRAGEPVILLSDLSST